MWLRAFEFSGQVKMIYRGKLVLDSQIVPLGLQTSGSIRKSDCFTLGNRRPPLKCKHELSD